MLSKAETCLAVLLRCLLQLLHRLLWLLCRPFLRLRRLFQLLAVFSGCCASCRCYQMQLAQAVLGAAARCSRPVLGFLYAKAAACGNPVLLVQTWSRWARTYD